MFPELTRFCAQINVILAPKIGGWNLPRGLIRLAHSNTTRNSPGKAGDFKQKRMGAAVKGGGKWKRHNKEQKFYENRIPPCLESN